MSIRVVNILISIAVTTWVLAAVGILALIMVLLIAETFSAIVEAL